MSECSLDASLRGAKGVGPSLLIKRSFKLVFLVSSVFTSFVRLHLCHQMQRNSILSGSGRWRALLLHHLFIVFLSLPTKQSSTPQRSPKASAPSLFVPRPSSSPSSLCRLNDRVERQVRSAAPTIR